MAITSCRNALHGVVGTGEGRDVRNLVLDGGLADRAFVLDGVALCPRRVDDEVHLLVQDDIEDVRAAFGDLVHHFALHAGGFVELGGAFGSVDLEAELLEFLADFNSLFGEVHLVRKANQHGTFVREEGTCGFLALVVGQGVVVGEAEDFAGGAHFGAENRVHLRELVEREHGFLGTVVVELLVLELEVFELGTEHQAGCEAGHLRVTNLGDQRHRAGHSSFGRSRTYMCGRAIFYELPDSVPAQPHKTKPCSQEYRTGTARKSSPLGVTIPNADSKTTPNSFLDLFII